MKEAVGISMEDYEAKARHGEAEAQMKIVSFPIQSRQVFERS